MSSLSSSTQCEHDETIIAMANRTRLRNDDEIDESPSAAKRQKIVATSNTIHATRYQPEDYTVSWVCALHLEMAAAHAMLDHIHGNLPRAPNDPNTYTLGSIGPHNIVITCLPSGYYGLNNAATVASNIERSFPSIEIHLMVGIGGGAPGKLDLRLGDIVVGSRVMQYDHGKIVGDGQLERTSFFRVPPSNLLTHIAKLRAIHESTATRVPAILREMHSKYPMMTGYAHPNAQDRLFHADYDHNPAATSCDGCDASMLVYRLPRPNAHPKIHYEAIASSNQVMKHGATRDRIAQELQVACFEMEAAGLMNFPYLTIRGICDYSDSHKNRQWQEYAAATAAAYAKEFLDTIPITSTKAVAQEVERRVDTESLQKVRKQFIDSLKFEQIDSRQSNIKGAYTTTCKWFLESSEYVAWAMSEELGEHHGLLWLSGKPGAGKSTIMKFAYTHVKSALGTRDAVVSFFFNARGDALEKTTTGMYRSLLLQLLKRFPDLQQVCEDSNLGIRIGSCPSLETIQILFRKAISMLGQRSLTCFIDALDECDELQIRDMVEYFEQLGQQAVEDKTELRICFSSRHYPYIFIRQGLRLTLEDQSGHGEDVEKYVQGNLRVESGPLLKEVQAQILQKAAGVFMWVVLVVDILNKEFSRGRMFAVKKRLAEIPDRLSDLFKDILKRDNENMEDLLLCLQWILFAKRPLIREEFYFAVSTGLIDEEEDATDCFTTSVSSDIMDRFVISSSKGLAEVTKSRQHTVQFIHESVRDFLIKDNGFQELWPEFSCDLGGLSHDKLKHCCYKYLKFNTSEYISVGHTIPTERDDAKKLRETVLKQAPFLQYATQHVLYHADIAASSIHQDDFLAGFNLNDWIVLSNLFEIYKIRRYTPHASLFYVLADRGFSALIQTRLLHDTHCYIQGERYRYPIFTALLNGYDAAVHALLGLNAREGDATRRLQYPQDHPISKDQESLIWAVQNGYEPIIQHLVEQDADVNITNQDDKPALLIAVEKGYTAIAKLLIEKGADVNAKDGSGKIAFFIAMGKSLYGIAELLIERGADISLNHESGEATFLIAVRKGYYKIAKFMVEKGANINAKDRSGQSAFIMALQKNHFDIAELLLERGADVNPRDRAGQPAFFIAMEKAQYAIAKSLIERGADVNAQDTTGETSLWVAYTHGQYDTVRLLIENGADINIRNNGGQTVLFQAIWNQHEDMVRLLIDTGADVSIKDTAGRTVLLDAVSNRDISILQLLLEKGADVNATDRHGRTPLLAAVSHRDKDIVQLFLDRGADINARNIDIGAITFRNNTGHGISLGCTALQLAAAWEHDDIVELLTNNGADTSLGDIDHMGEITIYPDKSAFR